MIDPEQQKHTHRVLTKILAGWVVVFLVISGLVIFTPSSASVLSGMLSPILPQPVLPLVEPATQMVRETTQTIWEKYTSIFKTLSAVAFKKLY